MEIIQFDNAIVEAAKLPLVRIDRELFLRKELKQKYSKEIVEMAVAYNPAYAGIKVEDINKIAKSCIHAETAKVTALSAAAGIPGGIGMLATVPADLAQYFAHILRILQELLYLYGWKELELDSQEMSEEVKNILTIFFGIMFGVNGAVNLANKVSLMVANQIVKKVPQQALTKGVLYPIVKKVASILGIKMTKTLYARGLSKVVPVLGAIFSGGLTLATFLPMVEKLRKHLASEPLADVNYYKNASNLDPEDIDLVEIIEEVNSNEEASVDEDKEE